MAKIGLMDSGFGGLTVLSEVIRQLPEVDAEYFGDSGRAPYGPRTKEEITKFVQQTLEFLGKKDIELAILACNTATAAALDTVEDKYDFPVLGIIKPGARGALKATKNKKIGVIGTIFTIESGAYQNTLKDLDKDVEVLGQACPPFCDLVEAGKTSGPEVEKIVHKYISVFDDSDIDTLVLGCTHYPVLLPVIKKFISPDVTIVDPAVEVVAQAKSHLKLDKKGEATYKFYTSGSAEHFIKIGENILGSPMKNVEEVRWE